VEEDADDVDQVLIYKNGFVARLFVGVELHVLQNVVQQMLCQLNVILCQFYDK